MSGKSRSQMPANAKKPLNLQNFSRSLSENLRKAREEQENDMPEDDMNILPFPVSQKVIKSDHGSWIEWVWEPGDLGIRILGLLYTTDAHWDDEISIAPKKQGQYEVQLSLPSEQSVHYFDSVLAEAIGKAMVSASNWINIWKEHAGMFMEKELFYGMDKESDE